MLSQLGLVEFKVLGFRTLGLLGFRAFALMGFRLGLSVLWLNQGHFNGNVRNGGLSKWNHSGRNGTVLKTRFWVRNSVPARSSVLESRSRRAME